MNFDESLAFVAADRIAEAWHAQKLKHRGAEGIFCLYMDISDGLASNPMVWKTREDYGQNPPVPELPDCVCPPWFKECYCREAPA